MPLVKFTATPALSKWVHRKELTSIERIPHEGAPGGMTTKVTRIEPILMNSGDEADMTDSEAAWVIAAYPDNFSTAAKVTHRKKKDIADGEA